MTLYLGVQDMIATTSEGCSALDNAATFAGYSEGGFACVAVALAFDALGYDVINVASGAAPFKTVRQLQWSIEQFDAGGAIDPLLSSALAFAGNSFSSTNPDLANSGTGQDPLADEWMDPNNYVMNVKAWLADDLTAEELFALIPNPYAPEIFRQSIVSLMQEASAMNSTDPCSSSAVGVTDKLCEALLANDLSQEVQDTTFRIVICHSPGKKL